MALVELDRFMSLSEAQIVRGRLASKGIEAVLFDAGLASLWGANHLLRVRLMVLEEDLETARGLLAGD